jgi:glycosyltransferase involved in cell wall biosynthesis
VVIPTRGREQRLAFALESLAGQLDDPGEFEVVVVRDRDAGPPFAQAPAGVRVRSLTLPGIAGPTAKRNLGWRATEAPVVAFTDDDCRAADGWLRGLLEAGEPGSFVQGRTEPDPDEVHLMHPLSRTVSVGEPNGWFETCNMAYPRELLDRLGGFDERFGFGGEDTDLAWRAIEAGAQPRFAEGALVWHAVVSRSPLGALGDALRWNDLPALVGRHPGLREHLYAGHFWNAEHMGLAVAAGGWLAFRRRAPLLAAAATVPYLAARLNWRQPHPRRLARGLATLPLLAAVDAAETLARIPSAVRNRVAVL